MKAEIGVMLLQAKECQGLQAMISHKRGMEEALSEPPKGTSPGYTCITDSGLLSRERINFFCCKSLSLW